jgi:hypothetical protein
MEGVDKLPSEFLKTMAHMMEIMAPVKTYDAQTFPVKVDGPGIFVNI